MYLGFGLLESLREHIDKMVKVLVIRDSIVNGNSDCEFGGRVNILKIDSMKF